MAEVVGLCMMCGRPGLMHTCQLCGRLVCERCFEHRYCLCTECKHQKSRSNTPSYPMD